MAMDADELYTAKNNFWLGNFTAAIDEARALKLRGEAVKLERDAYIYRALIAKGQARVAVAEIKDDASVPVGLRAIRLFALYHVDVDARGRVLSTLEEWVGDGGGADPLVAQMAAQVCLHECKWGAALKALAASPPSALEHSALAVQALVGLDRLDLADKTVKQMQAVDDESVLTCIAAATVNLAQGGDRLKEATMVYKDLKDRFGPSSVATNGLIASYIAQHRYDEAARVVVEALGGGDGSHDVDLLLNAVALASHQGKDDEMGRHLAVLKRVAPDHPYVQSLAAVEGMFDRVAAASAV